MSSTFSEIIKGDTPTLVDFFAEWCGPCKTMKPVLEELKSKVGSQVRIIKIDVDKNPNVASTYQIQSVPTLMIFKKGEVKWRNSGLMSVNNLQKIITQYISN